MNKTFLHILLLFCSCAVFAQVNLVPNGGFEDTVSCPSGADIYNAKYFSSPTLGTPDYFHVCSPFSLNFSVPLNGFGFQVPHSGNAYAAIVAYSIDGSNYREYIQTPLVYILESEQDYLVEFYVSLANNSPVAFNNLGFCFSDNIVSENTATLLSGYNIYYDNTIITDTTHWTKVSFLYTANGTERYLIIGNFKKDTDTDTITNIEGNTGTVDAFYYIDDISVTKFDYQIPNVFTPNKDGVNDIFFIDTTKLKPIEMTILNRWGNVVYSSYQNFSWDGHSNLGKLCTSGTYFYVIRTKNNTFKGFIELKE